MLSYFSKEKEKPHPVSDAVIRTSRPSWCFCLIRFRGAVSWYTVDLDLPPTKRWTAVITDKKADVRRLSSTLNKSDTNILFLLMISSF